MSVTHDPYVTSLILHGSEIRRTLTQVEKKSEIYVPVMKHFVNSIPEHVHTPESYHSMTHISFILTSSAYSRDLSFSQW